MVIPTTGRVRLAGARDYKAPSLGLAGQAQRANSVYKKVCTGNEEGVRGLGLLS